MADGIMSTIRPLTVVDAGALSVLLRSQRPEYMQGFVPFAFDPVAVEAVLAGVRSDRFWAIQADGDLAGFFMLRGFDEGYVRPSFGIVVGEKWAGHGLGRLALDHAINWCRANGVGEIMLKVAEDNLAAVRLYHASGFVPGALCPRLGHRIHTLTLEPA
jgi:GNAT superfamily N-acetyltransferase